MTLQEEFDKMITATYAPVVPCKSSEQYKQLRDAFFGGALVTLGSLEEVGFAVRAAELHNYIEEHKLRSGSEQEQS